MRQGAIWLPMIFGIVGGLMGSALATNFMMPQDVIMPEVPRPLVGNPQFVGWMAGGAIGLLLGLMIARLNRRSSQASKENMND